jgi:hypothetical protein
MKSYDSRAATDERIQKILRLRFTERLAVRQMGERFSMTQVNAYYILTRYGRPANSEEKERSSRKPEALRAG